MSMSQSVLMGSWVKIISFHSVCIVEKVFKVITYCRVINYRMGVMKHWLVCVAMFEGDLSLLN